MTCHNHTQCLNQALEQAQQFCQQQHLRFTPTREQVFKIIWGSHKALTAANIMEKLGNNQPPVTYRALEFLVANNLIHHIASLNSYVGCNHLAEATHIGQLLICSYCRDVVEIESSQVVEQLNHAAKKSGFSIRHAHIEVLGTCENCQTNTPAAT